MRLDLAEIVRCLGCARDVKVTDGSVIEDILRGTFRSEKYEENRELLGGRLKFVEMIHFLIYAQ